MEEQPEQRADEECAVVRRRRRAVGGDAAVLGVRERDDAVERAARLLRHPPLERARDDARARRDAEQHRVIARADAAAAAARKAVEAARRARRVERRLRAGHEAGLGELRLRLRVVGKVGLRRRVEHAVGDLRAAAEHAQRVRVAQPLARRDRAQRAAEGLAPRRDQLALGDRHEREPVALEDGGAQAQGCGIVADARARRHIVLGDRRIIRFAWQAAPLGKIVGGLGGRRSALSPPRTPRPPSAERP